MHPNISITLPFLIILCNLSMTTELVSKILSLYNMHIYIFIKINLQDKIENAPSMLIYISIHNTYVLISWN